MTDPQAALPAAPGKKLELEIESRSNPGWWKLHPQPPLWGDTWPHGSRHVAFTLRAPRDPGGGEGGRGAAGATRRGAADTKCFIGRAGHVGGGTRYTVSGDEGPMHQRAV